MKGVAGDRTTPPATARRRGAGGLQEEGVQPSTNVAAFLVRFWQEPRRDAGAAVMRGYVRNLRDGGDAYLSTPDDLPMVIRGTLAKQVGTDSKPYRWQQSGENRGAAVFASPEPVQPADHDREVLKRKESR